jgi:hypothetical protein
VAYFDDFSATANPIGGIWTNAKNTSKAQVFTTGGNAFGTGANLDGYAYINGAGDSVIESTVFRSASLLDTEANSYEFEHLHRVTDDAGNTNCYELDCGYAGAFNIVRWFGALGFNVLTGLVTDANFFPDGAGGQWRSNYRLKTELIKATSTINIYADSGSGYVKYFHYVLGTDTTNDNPPLASGDPAIAFFTTVSGNNWFGFTDTTITSLATGEVIRPPMTRAGRGPGMGPSMRRMMPQQFPITPAAVGGLRGNANLDGLSASGPFFANPLE